MRQFYMSVTLIELLPGVEPEPLFKTNEEYQKFREEFSAAVAPDLEKYARARALSERDSMYHLVD